MRSAVLAAALLLGASSALAQPPSPGGVVTGLPVAHAPVAHVPVAHAPDAQAPVAHAPVAPRASIITGIDAHALVAAFVRAGFTAETKTEAGQTYVIARQGATPFQAFLSNCQASGGGCTDIELFAGFSGAQRIAWERLNGWNARTRFTRAFLDEHRDPALQMDLSLQGGVSQDGLKTSLTTWGSALETYSLFLVARVPPVGAATPPTELTSPSLTPPVTLRPPNALPKG